MKRKILSILALVGFAILGVIFLKGRTDELIKILEVDLKYVLIIFILVILSSLFNGHKLKMLIQGYGVKLKFKEAWGLQIVTLFWNCLTPFKGGLSARAIYLKKKYSFPYTFSVSITGVAYLIDFLIYGLFGIIFSFFLPVSNEIKYSLLTFFTIIFLSSIFILFFLPLPKTNIRILKYVVKSIDEFKHVRKEYLLLFKLSLNTIARLSIITLRFYFAFLAFNFTVSFYVCIVIALFAGLAMVISITPMNLGFRESVVIISSKLFGTGALLGTFVAVLDRAVAMIWIFIAASIFSYILAKDFKIKKEKCYKCL